MLVASHASAASTELYSWGYNLDGQLGNGNTTTETTPVKVSLPAGVTATAAAAGGDHSLAIGSDGKLYAWGNNAEGQLGDGTTHNSSTPVVVSMPAGVTATAVAAGQDHSVALGSNGSVYDWGDNAFGELGNGTTNDATTPVKVTLPGGRRPQGRRRRPVHDRDTRHRPATCTPGATAPWASSATARSSTRSPRSR